MTTRTLQVAALASGALLVSASIGGCSSMQSEARGLNGQASAMQVCVLNNSGRDLPIGFDGGAPKSVPTGAPICTTAQFDGSRETTADIGADSQFAIIVLPHVNLPMGTINVEANAADGSMANVLLAPGQTMKAPNVPGLTMSRQDSTTSVNVDITVDSSF